VRERVLCLSLGRAVEAFEAFKWKFYEVGEEDGLVRVEVPRGPGEAFVVEIPYNGSQAVLEGVTKGLAAVGFIRQSVRVRSDW